MAQIAEVEAARDAVVTTTARSEDEQSRLIIVNLTRLRGIGPVRLTGDSALEQLGQLRFGLRSVLAMTL